MPWGQVGLEDLPRISSCRPVLKIKTNYNHLGEKIKRKGKVVNHLQAAQDLLQKIQVLSSTYKKTC